MGALHLNGLLGYTSLNLAVVILLILQGSRAQTTSSCYLFGTEHVYTFDKQMIDFRTNCQLTLASTCPTSALLPAHFSVLSSSELINSGDVSRAKCATVQYKDYTSVLCSDQTAKVNGDSVESILASNGELMVYAGTAGIELAIQVDTTIIRVTVTKTHQIKITVPDSYKSRLCGMCGNYDGLASSDLRTASKSDVSSLPSSEQGATIANSYRVSTSCSVQQFTRSSCENDPSVQTDLVDPLLCGLYSKQTNTGILSSCVSDDGALASTFYDTCVFDYCENYLVSDGETASGCELSGSCTKNATLAKEAVNSVSEVFAAECRARGKGDSNWRAAYDAAITCGSTEVYSYSGPRCPNACGLDPNRCSETDVEGCICSGGLVKEGNQCVVSSSCGCSDSVTGSYQELGTVWIDSECSAEYTCQQNNVIVGASLFCSEFSTCGISNGEQGCFCQSPYVGDGLTCELSCNAGNQPSADGQFCEECPVGTYKESTGKESCISCPDGQITDTSGSTTASDCQEIVLAAESSFATTIASETDTTRQIIIPTNVLPEGLPVGAKLFRKAFVSVNGLVTFGEQFVGSLSQNLENFKDMPIVAPFWFHQDLRVPNSNVQPLLSVDVEVTISSYNKIDTDAKRRSEAISALSAINVLLMSSGSDKVQGITFEPTYAFVVTWKNIIPYPAFYFSGQESAYYQCVVVTDGVRTFTLFIYPSGGMNLQTFYARPIYMGINAQDQVNVYSYFKSNTVSISNLETDPSNTNVPGRWVFKLANRGNDNPYAVQCQGWYNSQKYVFPFGLFENLGDPCPCSAPSSWADERFFFDFNTFCAITLNRKLSTGYFQQCCYDQQTFSLLMDNIDGGYPILFNPILTPSYFEYVDKAIYENCCVKSAFCELFREYRPVDTCNDYEPPVIASGFGDPHIYTLDGELYTYNPIGEFWMIESTDFTMQARTVRALTTDGELTQATQFQAFVMKALSPNVSATVQVEINNNRTDFEMRVDGVSVTNRFDGSEDLDIITYTGVTLKKFNSSISVSFATGFSFRFSLRHKVLSIQSFVPSNNLGKINGLMGHYDKDPANDLTNRDGKVVCVIGNDDCTLETIHYQFGETWRLKASESLFWYRAGWSTLTYTDTTFKPIFEIPTNDTLTAICNNDLQCIFDVIMTNNTELGADTALTLGEVKEKAKTLGASPIGVIGQKYIEAKVGEVFTAVYEVNYTGSADTKITLKSPYPPGATFVKDTETGKYSFTWTPADTSPHQIKLVASEVTLPGEESGSVSPEFTVYVRMSGTCTNGEPDYNTIAVGGITSPYSIEFSLVSCNCTDGWTGDNCDVDYNGCIGGPCYVGDCVDIPADEYQPGELPYYCNITACPTGYDRPMINGLMTADCVDVNECSTSNPCGTHSTCRNTEGSYKCLCATGYKKVTNSATDCEDINECTAGLSGCSHKCTNTEGSFQCSCYAGYSLDIDKKGCSPQTVSVDCTNKGCTSGCTDESGTATCICPLGQVLAADQVSCELVNECSDSTLNVCDAASGVTCSDLPVGYTCECPSLGYEELQNPSDSCTECTAGKYGHHCNETCSCGDRAKTCDPKIGCTNCVEGWTGEQCQDDINECQIADPCGAHSTCTNTNGGFLCKCASGFASINSTHCIDINECLTSNPCSKLAVCENTEGSYTCKCRSGYTGDGKQCTDVNECTPTDPTKYPCVELASCKNDLGSFGCLCPTGYHGDGLLTGAGCVNDNECFEAEGVCPGDYNKCEDTQGSYTCVCVDGFEGDGLTCTDIDECTDGTNDCDKLATPNGTPECTNTVGSFECSVVCNTGYKNVTDGSGKTTCTQINECTTGTHACPENSACQDTPGSYTCTCDSGYTGDINGCNDINECETTNPCTTLVENGVDYCTNLNGSHTCTVICNPGYKRTQSNTCQQVDECAENLDQCNDATEACEDTIGSYTCKCLPGFTKSANDVCVDIDECDSEVCTGEGQICINTPGSFNCTCKYGYKGIDCSTLIESVTFVEVEQVFDLQYDSTWNYTNSVERATFSHMMSLALEPLYNKNSDFLGINIITVEPVAPPASRKKRATDSYTQVNYNVVYDSKTVNLQQAIHQALDTLIAQKYMLNFNKTQIKDVLMIAFPGVLDSTAGAITCETKITVSGQQTNLIDCSGNGQCQVDVNQDYPMCKCNDQYTGYNCGSSSSEILETTELMPLWISVAVAGALLLGGLLACVLVMVYQRRQRTPQLHRYPRATAQGIRGPALFNPASRMPAEAFNYQFPSGSVRDDLSDSSSTISSGTQRTQRTEGRVGSTVPFAPRWPRAYYAQLGDPSDH